MSIETLGSGPAAAARVIPLAEARSSIRPLPPRSAQPLVPCVRLSLEPLIVDAGDGWSSKLEEVEAPVIELSFDYGGHRIRASDARERYFRSTGAGMDSVERDRAAEAHARYVLESFGAVDLACLPEYGIAPDSHADYLVHPEVDLHAICAFSAYALPQLQRLGWRIEIDPSYPYHVVAGEVPWYADVACEPERPDWFALELGVEVDGRRVNMLPMLLDVLEQSGADGTLRRLAQGTSRSFALPLDDGRYLTVPADRVRELMRVLVELHEGRRRRADRVRVPLCHAAALERLDQVFASVEPGLRWEGDDAPRVHGRRLARAVADVGAVDGAAPLALPGLRAELRSYQAAGVQWLQHLRAQAVGGVLADDMGLGKTLQVIAHLVAEKVAGRLVRPALVVCPTSLVGNWCNEIDKFAPHLRVARLHGSDRHAMWREVARCDVVITSYGLLVRDEARWAEHTFSTLILDEAHVIKNLRSQVHRAACSVGAEHRICLTGTPIENHLGELQALFEFLMPDFFGGDQRFRELYRVPIELRGDEERLKGLREQVAPYLLRRVKSEVARELPPKTLVVRPVELKGRQRDLYESIRIAAHADIRRAIRKKGFGGSALAILDALMKLRQLCCDPRLLSLEAARFVRQSAKLDLLMELVGQQLEQGRRLLIFSQFTRMLALISEALGARDIAHVQLTGATQNRQRTVDTFERGDVDVFLISLKAGGVGLNLTSADTVIHYDPWWNPAAQAQATDRAYRIGQKKPVFVYNLIVAGSVEERMLQLQRRKQHLAHTILGEADGFGLAEQEVEALLAPLDVLEPS